MVQISNHLLKIIVSLHQDDHSDSLNGETTGNNETTETNNRDHNDNGNLSIEKSNPKPVEQNDTDPENAGASESATSDAFESKDRFDALVRDRDSLRAEVVDMRRSLEEIQSKHGTEMESLQGKLSDAESKKEHAEVQFQKLLERVNIIKSQLGERLKEDAVCCCLYNHCSVLNFH